MYSFKALASLVILIGFSATEIMAQNGERTCVGGGITCNFKNGTRCSRLCDQKTLTCSCPDGHYTTGGVWNSGYTGAGCIPFTTAIGRHSC